MPKYRNYDIVKQCLHFSQTLILFTKKTQSELKKFSPHVFKSLIKVLEIVIAELQILCYLTVQKSPLTRLSCLSSLLVINCPWWIVSSIIQTTDLSSLDNSQLCWQMSAFWIRYSLFFQFYLMEICNVVIQLTKKDRRWCKEKYLNF